MGGGGGGVVGAGRLSSPLSRRFPSSSNLTVELLEFFIIDLKLEETGSSFESCLKYISKA